MKPIVVLACLIAAALAVPAQAEQANFRMYKCIDTAGKVYYSDKINPDCGQGSELNRQGMVMMKKEVAKPALASKADPVAAPAKSSKELDRRDRALMATYTTVEEIDAARDRSLAIPAEGIKTIESKLDKASRQLTELKKHTDTLATQKKPLPANVVEEINAGQRQVSGLEADLAQRNSQSDSIRARFEADKQRFRELKGADPK